MGETLTMRRRVEDDSLRVVNFCGMGRTVRLRAHLTVPC